jgi:translation initiation factor 4E
MHKLNNIWCLWYHSTNDNDWSINGYKKITEIDTIEKFWEAYQYITPNLIQNGMFFLMKQDILPIWEDKQNKNGGCWSFKIIKKDIYNSWLELSIHLLGCNILKDADNASNINGISVSPKRSFCIIKIWNKDSNKNNNNLLSTKIPYLYICDSIYKSHQSKN